MADDDDYEGEGVPKTEVAKVDRPRRSIVVLQHDTIRSTTEEIIEHAQVVLDMWISSEQRTFKDIAAKLKKRLDDGYGGMWHVIVGTHFGGNVTNDEETLVNFKIDGLYFLVLRSGPPDRPLVVGDGEEKNSMTA